MSLGSGYLGVLQTLLQRTNTTHSRTHIRLGLPADAEQRILHGVSGLVFHPGISPAPGTSTR
jgi:hypothetical protein